VESVEREEREEDLNIEAPAAPNAPGEDRDNPGEAEKRQAQYQCRRPRISPESVATVEEVGWEEGETGPETLDSGLKQL
jgi:hypothetical protein